VSRAELGRLEKVDLRQFWQREDTDFTPWLGEEKNILLLGESIEMDLEVQEQEASVGPFRADILCRNTADNSFVLIENQLERTDHSHLGQLLTYAAGLDAVTLIWIVERFTEEHRAALDWLNRITDDGFHFFGIEVELWRIGDSVPAPKFSLVAKPNDWSKTVREAAAAPAQYTESGRLKSEYWAALAVCLEKHGASFRPPKAKPWSWQGWGLGRTYFQLVAYVNVRDKNYAVALYLSGPDAEAHYQLLRDQQEEIESSLGLPLEWEKSAKDRKLIARRQGDTTDRSNWPEQHEWLYQSMAAFQRVFQPLIRELDASDWSGSEDER
jgi:hypothetical protein